MRLPLGEGSKVHHPRFKELLHDGREELERRLQLPSHGGEGRGDREGGGRGDGEEGGGGEGGEGGEEGGGNDWGNTAIDGSLDGDAVEP
jgi:hypothetical protein